MLVARYRTGMGSARKADEMTEREAGADQERRVDLVLEGGGVKGNALVGALSVLEERGFQSQNVAGASAGAIVAVLHAAGYAAHELRDLIKDLDFNRFRDKSWVDRIPLVGSPLSILTDLGIYEGEQLLEYIGELLEDKGVRTYADLIRDADEEEARYRYKAQIIASDITGRQLLVLPKDAPKLGVDNPDEFNVALSVRMSLSIPIFFEPVKFNNAKTGQDHLIVDGGLLSNFPVWLFDTDGEPEWPTFGLRLVEPDPRTTTLAERLAPPEHAPGKLEAVIDYFKSLVDTVLEAHDRLYIERADFARTIPIDTLGVRTTDFDLTSEMALALYESGRTAAEQFLDTWSFEGYIAAFRRGKEHSRRREVAELMSRASQRG
jgi:NTE family protein